MEELIVKEKTGGEVNERPCPVCKREDVFRYKETVEFKTLTKYLVINLKKYYYNGYDIVKNNSSVKFEEVLNMNNTQYEIESVIDHVGATVESGHWIMHIKTAEGFTTCNDSNISSNRRVEEIRGGNNTMFVYSKVERDEAFLPIRNPNISAGKTQNTLVLDDKVIKSSNNQNVTANKHLDFF